LQYLVCWEGYFQEDVQESVNNVKNAQELIDEVHRRNLKALYDSLLHQLLTTSFLSSPNNVDDFIFSLPHSFICHLRSEEFGFTSLLLLVNTIPVMAQLNDQHSSHDSTNSSTLLVNLESQNNVMFYHLISHDMHCHGYYGLLTMPCVGDEVFHKPKDHEYVKNHSDYEPVGKQHREDTILTRG
jgi:hypothetical protein